MDKMIDHPSSSRIIFIIKMMEILEIVTSIKIALMTAMCRKTVRTSR